MKIVCSRVGTIVLVLGLFLIGFFSCDMSTNYALADGGGTVPHACSLSDYLTDYFRWRYNFLPTPSNSAPLFFSGATIAEGDSSTEYVVTVTSDDPITNIVPRSLFESANTTLSMADGFAYCVHTWLDVGDGVFRTTVTFFSISTQWLLSTLDLRVDVIAKIDYVQVSNNSVVHLHGVLEDDETNLWNITAHLSGLESAVIPLFRLDHTQEPVVVDSMDMDVCNIWLATTIRSVNQLNNFDDGYNASVDSGYFLTSTRYQYAGQRHDEAGETQQIINRVQDICCGIIGMIPIVGNAFTLIYSGFCVADSFVSVPNIVYTRDDDIDMITTTYPLCATRSEQIQNYGYLLKTALMEIAPDDPLLFCTGDYVEGFYTYAHFDVGYVLGVTSQVLMNLGLMVKNSRTEATDFTVINDVVIAEKDAPTSGEQLEMCENNSFYMLPNTTHWFSFTPVYNGKYALSVNGTIGAVEINGLPVTPTGGEYRFEGIANTPIDILLYPMTDTITKGSISIDVATNTGAQVYAPLEARISKLSVASDGLYKIQSSETSVLLDQILVLENGSFDEYVLPFDQVGSDITWSSASVWNIPLPAGEYYVLCRNSGDSDKNASVSKSSITQTNRNTTKVLTLSATNYTFIKFVPSDSQDNAVAVSNNAQGLECILVYADASAYYVHVSSHGFSFGGSQGTPIYIGFRALNNVSVSVKIKLDANAYKWIIDGSAISGQQVSLNVNRSYSLCLRVNDVYTAETLDLQNSYSGIALINPSTLVLTDDTSLGTPFLLQAVAGVGINYAYSLCVTPVFSHSFAVSAVNNASQVGLTWTSQDYGYTSTVWAACNDNNTLLDSFTISTSASSNTGTVDLVALASQACASCRFITLRLTRVMTSHHIQDVPAETAPSVRVDTWFGGGLGTQASPNLIKNIRHFNNIRHAEYDYYKQTVNLNFGGTCPTIGVSFRGVYDANYKKIIGIVRVACPSNSPNNGVRIGGLFDYCSGQINYIQQYSVTLTVQGNLNSRCHVGGMVGELSNGGSVGCVNYNAIVSCNSQNNACCVGGVAGRSSGTINAIMFVNINVNACGHVGGLVGDNYNAGTINGIAGSITVGFGVYSSDYGVPQIGGVVGCNRGTVEIPISMVDVVVTCVASNGYFPSLSPNVGVVVGYNNQGYVTYPEYDEDCYVDLTNLSGVSLLYAGNRAIGRDNPPPPDPE